VLLQTSWTCWGWLVLIGPEIISYSKCFMSENTHKNRHSHNSAVSLSLNYVIGEMSWINAVRLKFRYATGGRDRLTFRCLRWFVRQFQSHYSSQESQDFLAFFKFSICVSITYVRRQVQLHYGDRFHCCDSRLVNPSLVYVFSTWKWLLDT